MKMIAMLVAVMFVGLAAHAEDPQNTTTTDTSKNPITGTVTTTKKTKKHHKGAHTEAKMESTEKTKEMKDGSMKKSTDTESSTETH